MDSRKEKSDIVVWEDRSASGGAADRDREATVRTVAIGGHDGEEGPILLIVSSGFGERLREASAPVRSLRSGARMSMSRAA